MTDEPIFDPHLFGSLMSSQADKAAKMYALVTATDEGWYGVTNELLDEMIAEGPDSIKAMVYALTGSFLGMINLFSSFAGTDPRGFLASLATGNSTMGEVGREIVRQAERG